MNIDAAKDSRDLLRLEFWKLILDAFKQKNQKLFASVLPLAASRLDAESEIDSCFFSLLFSDEEIGVEFNMERPMAGENRFIFDELRRHKGSIDKEQDAKLKWSHNSRRKTSCIYHKLSINTYDREQWPFMIDWLITHITNLENSICPLLPSINKRLIEATQTAHSPTNISVQNAIDQIFAVANSLPQPATATQSATQPSRVSKTSVTELRKELWTRLLPAFVQRGITLYSRISPSTSRTLSAGSGLSSCPYKLGISENCLSILFSMERAKTEENKLVFDLLYNQKNDIEFAFGGPFAWHRLDDKKASRIEYKLETDAFNETQWPTLIDTHIDWYADHILRLDKVLQPLLATIRTQL